MSRFTECINRLIDEENAPEPLSVAMKKVWESVIDTEYTDRFVNEPDSISVSYLADYFKHPNLSVVFGPFDVGFDLVEGVAVSDEGIARYITNLESAAHMGNSKASKPWETVDDPYSIDINDWLEKASRGE